MDAEVLVVGAGPVGLLLAVELSLAGVEPLVVDRLERPAAERKARGVGPLAAEAMARRGLAAELAVRHPGGSVQRVREHGSAKGHFAWLHKIDPRWQDEPDRRGVLIWQPDLEAVLRAALAARGVPIHRGHTVTALVQDPDGVTVDVVVGQRTRRLRVGYVAGCDGGRSTVRRCAGFSFHGTPPIMVGRQAAVELCDPGRLPPSGRTPTGMLIHSPGRVGTFEFDGPPVDRDVPVTGDELRASVRRVAGVDVDIAALGDALRFTDAAFQADGYRRGRVLLAGDAAHVHSPNGGQGLNLGLVDAVNLGWKLAAHVRGAAPPGLLDSYTRERHPVGAAVLRNTRAQSALMRPGPHTDALRDIVADLMDIPEVSRYFGRMLSGLDWSYPVLYATAEHHPLTGRHCPDLPLTAAPDSRPRRLSEFTTGGRPQLLVPGRLAEVGAGWRDWVDVVEVESVDHTDIDAVLVRPDGVVAWAAQPSAPPDLDLLRTALRTWFGPARWPEGLPDGTAAPDVD